MASYLTQDEYNKKLAKIREEYGIPFLTSTSQSNSEKAFKMSIPSEIPEDILTNVRRTGSRGVERSWGIPQDVLKVASQNWNFYGRPVPVTQQPIQQQPISRKREAIPDNTVLPQQVQRTTPVSRNIPVEEETKPVIPTKTDYDILRSNVVDISNTIRNHLAKLVVEKEKLLSSYSPSFSFNKAYDLAERKMRLNEINNALHAFSNILQSLQLGQYTQNQGIQSQESPKLQFLNTGEHGGWVVDNVGNLIPLQPVAPKPQAINIGDKGSIIFDKGQVNMVGVPQEENELMDKYVNYFNESLKIGRTPFSFSQYKHIVTGWNIVKDKVKYTDPTTKKQIMGKYFTKNGEVVFIPDLYPDEDENKD